LEEIKYTCILNVKETRWVYVSSNFPLGYIKENCRLGGRIVGIMIPVSASRVFRDP